jgi:two-component system, cell cycle sensor histidine kinase and response regulator CckA
MNEAAGATILLADDEPAIRSFIEAALSAEGYQVLAACNGYEALDVFDQRGADIDLLITDMCMPYIGGSELIAALQARRASLKCLCISSFAIDARLGFPLLQKPFSPEELVLSVQDALSSRPVSLAACASSSSTPASTN